jgi:hypothetical protein
MHRALIAVAAALAIPASASAATYCVSNAACEQAGGTHEQTIQGALGDAAQNPGHDDVSIGAGNFVENLTSSDPAGVTISGLGADKTVISPSVSGAPSYPFTVVLDGPERLTNLRVSLPATDRAQGVLLRSGATADNIRIEGGAVDAEGAELDDATLRDSAIDLPHEDSLAVRATGAGATLERDSISALTAVYAIGDASSTTRLHAVALRVTGGGGANALVVARGGVRLSDAVLDVRGSANGRGLYVSPVGAATQATVDARHVSIIGSGLPYQIGIGGYANDAGATSSITARDSILYDLATPVERTASGTATVAIALDHADRWPDNPVKDTPGGGQITDSNRLTVDPGFADVASSDFTLGASSPLIDTGTPGGLDAGEPDTDFSGAPRIADGNGDCAAQRDIGAYERAAGGCSQPPAVDPGPTPPPPAADTTAPKLTGVKLQRRHRTLVVRFRLSEAATVKVKAGKRLIAKRLSAGSRTIKVARVSRHRLRVSLTATDPAGNRARLTRRIR